MAKTGTESRSGLNPQDVKIHTELFVELEVHLSKAT